MLENASCLIFLSVQCSIVQCSIYKTFDFYNKLIAAISTIISYLFMCQLNIKQSRHWTSWGLVGEHMQMS